MNPTALPDPPQTAESESGSSLGRDAWLRLKRNRLAYACLWSLGGILVLCAGGALLSLAGVLPDPNATHLDHILEAPGVRYLLGSDALGRDVFTRILFGGLVSIAVGVVATLVSVLIGVTYGAVAGYVGGRCDAVMMRFVDILYAMPFVILVVVLMALFGMNLFWLFIAIGAVEWLTMARIVRAQVMALKRQEFMEAARSLGLGHAAILFRHLIPNCFGPIIVYTTLTVPSVMRLEAVLSFLGMGVQPPNSSWGCLIKEGADRMTTSAGLLVFPAAAFAITLFCLNFLGDGLRDALDPKGSRD
ncbi:MAG: oligopeptide transport system permease protein [Verrucomicrobia bacterium]|jgi:oligopeptide transport system permease protein|nr:MAG: oligopeptide transport system permease protein [Verrucomicrobiota bacterium]